MTQRLRAAPGGDLTHATTSLDTRHGRVTVAWRRDGGTLSVDTALPDGVTGVLRLPGQADLEISGHTTREVAHA